MSLKIVFMGTPEFAVPSLQAIKDSRHTLVAVVTSPDKRGGRGRKQLIQSAVKKRAINLGIPLLQPRNLKDENFLRQLAQLEADIFVIVAFRMLPEVVWNMPPLGSINLHASLLPDYRGAAPINWAIIHGEKKTGLTTFQLQHHIDTGDILLQHPVPIYKHDNAEDLHDRLMGQGPEILLKTLEGLDSGDLKPRRQETPKKIKLAPKLHKENTHISFNRSAESVYNFIRGLSPYPGAWTTLNGLTFKIFTSEIKRNIQTGEAHKPGDILIDKDEMYVMCTDYGIKLTEVQLQGKRRMNIVDFLNGYQEPLKALGE